MTKYLLDTNIVLQFSNFSDSQHDLVTDAVAILLTNGHDCYLTPQVFIEMCVVATRTRDVNELGWSTVYIRRIIDELFERFLIVEETPQIFSEWLELVTNNAIKGKRIHGVRIIALISAWIYSYPESKRFFWCIRHYRSTSTNTTSDEQHYALDIEETPRHEWWHYQPLNISLS